MDILSYNSTPDKKFVQFFKNKNDSTSEYWPSNNHNRQREKPGKSFFNWEPVDTVIYCFHFISKIEKIKIK